MSNRATRRARGAGAKSGARTRGPADALAVALAHRRAGRPRDAEAACRQILAAAPDRADALNLLGVALLDQGRAAEALECCRRAIALQPGNDSATFNAGLALRRLGRLEEAAESFRRAAAAKPDNADAHFQVGSVLLDLRRRAEAEAAFRRALACRPAYPGALHNLGLALEGQGRLEDAAAAYRQALAQNPSLALSHNNLANVLQAQGRLDEAIEGFRRALAHKPDFALAHTNLGNTLRLQGRLDDAVACHRQALALQPGYAAAHNNLGSALRDLGQVEAAEESYRRALAIDPNFADAQYNLGLAQLAQRRPAEAAESFRRALALRPDHADGHYSLGIALQEMAAPAAAAESYRRAIAVNPDHADAHYNLGLVLVDLKQPEEAAASYQRALEADPRYADAANNLGNTLRGLGRVEEAIESFQRAIALRPEVAHYHNNLGTAVQDRGEIDAAADCFRRAVALRTDYAEAYYNLSLTKKNSLTPAEAEAAAAALRAPGVSTHDALHLHFALAKACHDRRQFERAFHHYREANRLKRSGFDQAVHVRWTSRVIAAYPAELFQRLGAIGDPSTRPLFIVGMPRSGTSLVEQIVSSHPRVFGAGELPYLNTMVDGLQRRLASPEPYPENVARLDAPALRALATDYLARLNKWSADAPRVTDKMPQNFWFLGLIALMFPQTRVIHCRRDPMDTCLSCYFQNFSSAMTFSYDLSDLGLYYREYERLMAHWRRVLPIPMLDLQYEELVADQEAVSRRIIAFCGLDWDDRCLRFHENERAVLTASNVQVRQKLYGSSIMRWKDYEPFLGPLKAALGMAADESAPAAETAP